MEEISSAMSKITALMRARHLHDIATASLLFNSVSSFVSIQEADIDRNIAVFQNSFPHFFYHVSTLD